CAQGVCCNAACADPCAACDLPGSVGTCTLRPAGAAAAACLGTLCDGQRSTCPSSCAVDSDCATGYGCKAGACGGSNGKPGASGAGCAGGLCVDGVCCNAACGPCGRCDAPGSVGTCVARAAGAAGSPSCLPYVCDGASTTCPTTCSGNQACAAGATCDA